MIAVIVFAVALFTLSAAAMLGVTGVPRLVVRTVLLAAALVVVASGLAVDGAARYTTCVLTTSGAHSCPNALLGIRDPFSP